MLHILIMEDDVNVGLELADNLRSEGHEVHLETSGSAAFAAYQSEPFDMVISDLLVYSGDNLVPDGGVSLIAKIRSVERKSPRQTPIPIIAISGAVKRSGVANVMTSASTVGATITMQKPVVIEQLLDFAERIAMEKGLHP